MHVSSDFAPQFHNGYWLSLRRKTIGEISGQIDIQPSSAIARRFAYVPQDMLFVPTMTVIQTLNYYAKLQLWNQPAGIRKQSVLRLLRAMDLVEVQDSLAGGMGPGGVKVRTLSGGQQRRLAIACRLVCAPDVIFLDEPLSGLDALSGNS